MKPAPQPRTPSKNSETYYRTLPSHGVDALWKHLGDLLPAEPKSKALPHLWRYQEIRPLLLRAGEIVTAEEAERRVLMLQNPGLHPKAAAVTNVYAGLQLVLPGEVAPAHHHAAAALRFVVEGSGGYTTVDGTKAGMDPGDLILTPSWTRHEHGNVSDAPMIWLDGLDLPLINDLEANFLGGPRGELSDPPPHIKYAWSDTEAALETAVEQHRSTPADAFLVPYAQPATGGPTMPTLGAAALRPIYGSDIGHFDLSDMRDAAAEAWELVEKGVLDEETFRDFVFTHPVQLKAEANPDFFKGSAVEGAVATLLGSEA